jgi:D-alanyl-D-alanine carboxypeptidase (penicillin-binding protein 5/6)
MKKLLSTVMLFILLIINPLSVFANPADIAYEVPNQGNLSITIEDELLPPPVDLTADGAVVIEQQTGKVLHGKHEHKQLYPASTTKILTALIAAEFGHLDDVVTVGDEVNMLAWDGSKAGLVQNEKITLRNLVYGLMINSGNDAANTIAVHIARSVSGQTLSTQEALEYFGEMMNKRAKEAGALDSHFVNPHGYHDPDHYTTAYDLAMIGRAAMENDFFRKVVSTTSMDTTYWLTGQPRYWRSKNKLLLKNDQEYYEYATGGKTGYTSKAGQCLVSFATKDDMDLITVIMNSASKQQWSDTKKLFEYGFSNFKYHQVLRQGAIVETLPVDNYASDDWGSLAIEISAQDWSDVFHKKVIPQIRYDIQWDPELVKRKDSSGSLPRLEAPVTKGQVIGELTVTLGDKVLVKAPLTAVRDVKKRTILDILTPIQNEAKEFNWMIPVASLVLAFIALKILVFFINRKRRRRYYYRY